MLEILGEALPARLDEFGITRLAETTGLDRLGIPTHACVKVGTSDTISVYSGKGLSTRASQASAILECVERTYSLWTDDVVVWARRSELPTAPVWGPERFTERAAAGAEELTIGWVAAQRIPCGAPVWVPAELVFGGQRSDGIFAARTSNGLAAGMTVDDALGRALAELIERDAVSSAELEASHSSASFLLGVAERIGSDVAKLAALLRDDVDLAMTLDPRGLPDSASGLVQAYEAAEIPVVIKRIPSDMGVPVFGVAACEILSFDQVLATAGYGVGLDPERALCAALLEVAQSRATDRQGAREDIDQLEKARHDRLPTSHWLASPGTKQWTWTDLDWPKRTFESDVTEICARLRSVGLVDAAYFEFKGPAGLCVVRALVPGIETWHATGGASKIGPRMKVRLRSP